MLGAKNPEKQKVASIVHRIFQGLSFYILCLIFTSVVKGLLFCCYDSNTSEMKRIQDGSFSWCCHICVALRVQLKVNRFSVASLHLPQKEEDVDLTLSTNWYPTGFCQWTAIVIFSNSLALFINWVVYSFKSAMRHPYEGRAGGSGKTRDGYGQVVWKYYSYITSLRWEKAFFLPLIIGSHQQFTHTKYFHISFTH